MSVCGVCVGVGVVICLCVGVSELIKRGEVV